VFKCAVEMFGLPYNLTDLREVEIELQDGDTLKDVIITLKEKFPLLEGVVFQNGEHKLAELYKFSVNGSFFYDDTDIEIKEGDRIALLNLVTGG
jgi:molybdopterin converting factor small subunit